MEIFCNTLNIFTVPFDQFNKSLIKSTNLFFILCYYCNFKKILLTSNLWTVVGMN